MIGPREGAKVSTRKGRFMNITKEGKNQWSRRTKGRK